MNKNIQNIQGILKKMSFNRDIQRQQGQFPFMTINNDKTFSKWCIGIWISFQYLIPVEYRTFYNSYFSIVSARQIT